MVDINEHNEPSRRPFPHIPASPVSSPDSPSLAGAPRQVRALVGVRNSSCVFTRRGGVSSKHMGQGRESGGSPIN